MKNSTPARGHCVNTKSATTTDRHLFFRSVAPFVPLTYQAISPRATIISARQGFRSRVRDRAPFVARVGVPGSRCCTPLDAHEDYDRVLEAFTCTSFSVAGETPERVPADRFGPARFSLGISAQLDCSPHRA